MSQRRLLVYLVIAGFAWRLWVGSQVVVPREDGVTYLWMAERFAAGEVGLALGEIFSPLLSLLVAVGIALGVEPFFAGQVTLAIAGSLAIVPIARISEELVPGSMVRAALLTFVSSRLVMLGTQIYTEPLFLLLAASAYLCGLRASWWSCGVLCGLAFWVRPEAALIPLALLFGGRSAWRAWRALVPLGVAIVGLLVWRGLCGHGYDPVPKLAFIAAHNVADQTGGPGFVLRSVAHLALIPGRMIEAFAAIAGFALIGVFRGPRSRPGLILLGMAVAVICCYVPRWRFLVNWMFTLVPLAAIGVGALPGVRWWLGATIVVDLVLASTGGVDPNRSAEREVAAHVRAQLVGDQRVAGDMTRVLYFAGQRPLQPRHHAAEELIAAGREAEFVVLRRGRDTTPAVVAGLRDHVPYPLPAGVADRAGDRGILVLRRR